MQGDEWELDEEGHFLLYDDGELVLEGDVDELTLKEWKQILKERDEEEEEEEDEE
jgi:hypothetical protein